MELRSIQPPTPGHEAPIEDSEEVPESGHYGDYAPGSVRPSFWTELAEVFARATQRRSAILAVAVGGTMLFLLTLIFREDIATPVQSSQRLLSWLKGLKGSGSEDENKGLYYDWRTTSAFYPVSFEEAAAVSAENLCAAFPTQFLEDVQVVLKTGHGVLESRVHPQLHAGLSCIGSLLIFSDLTEEFEGRQLIDVIADTPQHLIDLTEQLEPYRRLRQCIVNNETADCGETTTGREGWLIDKWKFLPSVLRAWDMRPEREWYVFLEADTYMLWDTVFNLLLNFDPDEPHYFGSPSPGRTGTWFAYGGTGYLISREAMRKLVSKDDQEGLIESHWDELLHDCCGDSILGWALHERGVDLSGLWPMFNPHSPRSIPFSSRYWCQPVLSMHKPQVDELEELWRWEWRERHLDRPLLYRDLAVSFFEIDKLPGRKEGWDNAAFDDLGFDSPPGGETVRSLEAGSVDDCSKACDGDEHCFSWTHHVTTCKLVYAVRFGKAQYLDPEDGDEAMPDTSFVAGWPIDRIKAWIGRYPCETVQWVKPSVERIF